MKRIFNVLLVILFVQTLATAAEKPNFLFIFCDDLTSQAISSFGDARKLLDTPNIDRLAKDGMRFRRCLVPNSICGPSRATVLTGKYSHRNGFYCNEAGRPFDGSQQTFPKLLQKAGYQTALIGKWHLESDPTGFDHWHIVNGQGIYYNPPMIKDGKQVKHMGYTTDLITDFSIDWIKSRDKSRPFLLMSHKAPHREWAPALRHLGWDNDRTHPEPETLFDSYDGNRGLAWKDQDMTLEKSYTDRDAKLFAPEYLTPEQRKEWDAYYEPRNAKFRAAKLTGKDLVRWRYQRYMHDYLGTIKAVDESVGRLLDFLDESGLAKNTVVIFSSDQGFYLGEHGWFDKRWILEESLTTPLLVRAPGLTRPGTETRQMVSVLDFAQTFLDLAGLPQPADMQGRSFVPLLRGQTPADWRTSFYYHYYEYPLWHKVRPHYGVVTDRYKLVHYYKPDLDEWELYDLKANPNETKNFIDDPAYADTVVTLRKELVRLRQELKVPPADQELRHAYGRLPFPDKK